MILFNLLLPVDSVHLVGVKCAVDLTGNHNDFHFESPADITAGLDYKALRCNKNLCVSPDGSFHHSAR